MFSEITIVGAGRIGQAFAKMGQVTSVKVSLLRRGEQTLLPTGPIVVCTRNDDLEGVLQWIPPARYADLILVQNGMLQTWIAQNKLQNITQALLYIAVSNAGDAPVDGEKSVVTGPNAEAFVWLMNALNLQCRSIDNDAFLMEMLEKLLWNCVFGLLCQVHEQTVGTLVVQHREQISALSKELLVVACTELDLEIPASENQEELVQRLCDYSQSISSYQGAVKEWSWRNGWFWERQNEEDSIHGCLLKQAGLNL